MSDALLDDCGVWLNDALFGAKADSDTILWLGDNRWLIASVESPGPMFVVEVYPVEVKRA